MGDEAFEAYAKAEGLSPVALAGVALHEYTPMMSIGRAGSRGAGASGPILGGVPATLLHSTYASDADERHEFTVIVAVIDEAVAFARNLSCRDRKVQDELGRTELARFGDSREVELESIDFDRRFALQAPPGIDASWLRQLFTPSLIDALSTSAPAGFCFELNEGHFCAAVPGHVDDAAALDAFIAAAARAAGRIREEAQEGAGRASQATHAAADPGFERLLGKVKFKTPPADVDEASDRYMGVAMRRPGNFLRAIGSSLTHGPSLIAVLLIVGAVIAFSAGGAASSIGANAAAWAIPALLAAIVVFWLNVRRQAKALAEKLGQEAFVRGYAGSRGLTIGDPGGFQVEHARLKLPGAVRHVMTGALPGTALQGSIALVDAGVEHRAQLSDSATEAVSSGFMGWFGLSSDDNRTFDAVVFDSTQSPGSVTPLPAAQVDPASAKSEGSLAIDLMRQAMQMWQGSSQNVLSDGNTRACVRSSSRRGRSAAGLDALCAQAASVAAESTGQAPAG
jgi:hypothetical protein